MSALRPRIRRRVLVTLKSGQSFLGVLWQAPREAVVLRNAAQIADGHAPVAVDGEVVILRPDIAYMQFP